MGESYLSPSFKFSFPKLKISARVGFRPNIMDDEMGTVRFMISYWPSITETYLYKEKCIKHLASFGIEVGRFYSPTLCGWKFVSDKY